MKRERRIWSPLHAKDQFHEIGEQDLFHEIAKTIRNHEIAKSIHIHEIAKPVLFHEIAVLDPIHEIVAQGPGDILEARLTRLHHLTDLETGDIDEDPSRDVNRARDGIRDRDVVRTLEIMADALTVETVETADPSTLIMSIKICRSNTS